MIGLLMWFISNQSNLTLLHNMPKGMFNLQNLSFHLSFLFFLNGPFFLKFDWCFRRGVRGQCVTVPVFSSHSSLYFDWKAQSDPSPSLWLRPPVSPSHWYMRPLRASDWLLRPVLSHLECLDWSSGPHTSQGQNHQNGITIKKISGEKKVTSICKTCGINKRIIINDSEL